MNAIPVQVLLSIVMLSVTQFAAADDYKVIKLEQDVRRLEQQVRELSRQITELRREPAQTSPTSSRETATPAGSPAWLQAKSWQQLKVGMSELEVIGALGPPTSMRAADADTKVLLYALEIGTSSFLSGSVELRDRRVVAISEPALK